MQLGRIIEYTSFKKIWLAVLITALLALAIFFFTKPVSKLEIIANNLLGEKWYQIRMGENQIGYMHNAVAKTQDGDWQFESTSYFNVLSNNPVTTSKTLIFSHTPPHVVSFANFRTIQGSIDNEIEALLQKNVYEVSVRRGTELTKEEYDWQFNLRDYLTIEMWLESKSPSNGDTIVSRSLDLEKLRVTKRKFNLVNKNKEGYLIQSASPISPTKIFLNSDLQTEKLEMAGIFAIEASDIKVAKSLAKITSRSDLHIPVRTRLLNTSQITQIDLRTKLNQLNDKKIRTYIPDTLSSHPVAREETGNPDAFLGETLRYPVNHPKIRALNGLPSNISTKEDLDKLVAYTNSLLSYRTNYAVGSVVTALERGYGECTDFADLFTTLARSLGLAARPVYGIAYRDGGRPKFMFHAWNEVYINDQWISVDATWNQNPADSTHISLDDNEYSAILLASTTKSVEFEVTSVSYD